MADASKWGIYQDVLVQQNTDYTFSIDVNAQLWMECRALTTTTSADGTITPTGIVANSGWDEQFVDNDYNYDNRRFSRTFNTGNYKAYRFFLYGYNLQYGYDSNKASFFNHPQLEIGTKATDWTPSPFDTQEELDSKASVDDINMIISGEAKNLLKRVVFNVDDYDTFLTTNDSTKQSNYGWTRYNVSNAETFESSGSEWTMIDTGDNDYELYGYQLDIDIYQFPEETGEYWSNAGLYQDVDLNRNRDYVFSVYSMMDYLPNVKVVTVLNGVEGSTIWDSRDTGWNTIPIETVEYDYDFCRAYHSFNTGNDTWFRIKIYGGEDLDNPYTGDYEMAMNYFQLEKGTVPTKWEKGFDTLTVLQDQVNGVVNYQTQLNETMNDMNATLTYTHESVEGGGKNWLYDTDWYVSTDSYPKKAPSISGGGSSWYFDDSPAKETWNGLVAYGPGYPVYGYDTGVETVFDLMQFDYDYNYSGETHSQGDITYLEGGFYQNTGLWTNHNYTFSVLTQINEAGGFGAFIDCKAVSNGAIVPNTGFTITEFDGYSGTRDWEVEEYRFSSDVQRIKITFNTGSYMNWRIRIFGALLWESASTPTKLYSVVGRLALQAKSGIGYNDGIWNRDEEYSIRSLYYRSSTLGILDRFYPVGSYYETSDVNFNPNYKWGGTWILETAGMVHVSGAASGTYVINGANSASGAGAKDGGAATVALTAAQTGIRNHTHTYSDYNTTYTLKTTNRKPGTSTAVAYGTGLTAGGGATTRTSNNPASEQNGAAHENMPPYIVVYRWHRTA